MVMLVVKPVPQSDWTAYFTWHCTVAAWAGRAVSPAAAKAAQPKAARRRRSLLRTGPRSVVCLMLMAVGTHSILLNVPAPSPDASGRLALHQRRRQLVLRIGDGLVLDQGHDVPGHHRALLLD